MDMEVPTVVFMKLIASISIFLMTVVALSEQVHFNSTFSTEFNVTAISAHLETSDVRQTEHIIRVTTTRYVDRTLITETCEIHASRTVAVPSSTIPSGESKISRKEIIFYAVMGIGCVISLIIIILLLIAVYRMQKSQERRKRLTYLDNINRFVMSEQPSPAEINEGFSENPMYDGQRARQSSNVLYGEAREETSEETISQGQNNPIYDATSPDRTELKLQYLSNNDDAIITPSNADDLYTEPTSLSTWYDTGNYERVKSFIQGDQDNCTELEEVPNSLVVTDNIAYVSADRD